MKIVLLFFYKEKRSRLVSRQPPIISTIYIQSDEPNHICVLTLSMSASTT